jgi:DNA-binding CsgD family transcriptional regulator
MRTYSTYPPGVAAEEGQMASFQLTHREDEVLQLAVTGISNDEIAGHLAISRRTVEAHMRALFRKTGVNSRAQLTALYHQGAETTAASSPSHQKADPQDWRLTSFAGAVRGLVDRQFPLFEERVELTLVVGEEDGQDSVVERRWTTPRPYLVYRILGPILAGGQEPPPAPEELAPSCEVKSQDIQADVHQVLDVTGRPLLLVLFQPGLQSDVEWVLRYRSPQLWTPLRRTGTDSLGWSTATFDQRHSPTTRELTVKVVFPASWTGEQLTEQNNLGTVSADRLPTGQMQLTWQHDNPDAGAYRWSLHGSPGGSPAVEQ